MCVCDKEHKSGLSHCVPSNHNSSEIGFCLRLFTLAHASCFHPCSLFSLKRHVSLKEKDSIIHFTGHTDLWPAWKWTKAKHCCWCRPAAEIDLFRFDPTKAEKKRGAKDSSSVPRSYPLTARNDREICSKWQQTCSLTNKSVLLHSSGPSLTAILTRHGLALILTGNLICHFL